MSVTRLAASFVAHFVAVGLARSNRYSSATVDGFFGTSALPTLAHARLISRRHSSEALTPDSSNCSRSASAISGS